MLVPREMGGLDVETGPEGREIGSDMTILESFFYTFDTFPTDSPSIPGGDTEVQSFFLHFDYGSPIFFVTSDKIVLLGFLTNDRTRVDAIGGRIEVIATGADK